MTRGKLAAYAATSLVGRHSSRLGQDFNTYKYKTGKECGRQIMQTVAADRITEVGCMDIGFDGPEAVPKGAYITKVADLVCGVSY